MYDVSASNKEGLRSGAAATGKIVPVFKGIGMFPNESRKRFVATQTLPAQMEVS